MIQLLDDTFFFTKSYLTEETAREVLGEVDRRLEVRGNFTICLDKKLEGLSKEFLEEFYAPMKDKAPEGVYETMTEDLAQCKNGVFLRVLSGPGITLWLKDTLGPTYYKDNIGLGTLREFFGDPNAPSWRNVGHAPKPNEVLRDKGVMMAHGLF